MSRVTPLSFEELDSELQPLMAVGEELMGFMPNDGLIMARKPAVLKAILGLLQSIDVPGSVTTELKKLVGLMASSASGCQYCQAHTEFGAFRAGIDKDKIAAIWEYERHSLFSDAERAALDLARYAAMTPNGVTDDQFKTLRCYFDDEQIVELVSVIALFGFLNRWNSTFETAIEPATKSDILTQKH